jgi:multimeric flavodoxin WrbA
VYDDFVPIDKALREADIFAIASPVYGLGFPAPLKAIFDRSQQYFEAKFSLGIQNPIEKHKYGFLLASYGSGDPRGVAIMEEQLRLEFRLLNASLERTLSVSDTDKRAFNPASVRDEMKELALDIKRKL